MFCGTASPSTLWLFHIDPENRVFLWKLIFQAPTWQDRLYHETGDSGIKYGDFSVGKISVLQSQKPCTSLERGNQICVFAIQAGGGVWQ